jgi:hypothetical protein
MHLALWRQGELRLRVLIDQIQSIIIVLQVFNSDQNLLDQKINLIRGVSQIMDDHIQENFGVFQIILELNGLLFEVLKCFIFLI